MKRCAALFLLLVYATASFGYSVKQFYCCGKLVSVSIVFKQENNEKCGKGDQKDGCCKDQFLSLKVKDGHMAAADGFSNPAKFFADLHILVPFYQTTFLTALQRIAPANPANAPPLVVEGVPLYISNCIYRI